MDATAAIETQAPIAGARVRIHPMDGHLPGPDNGTTGDDGIVRVMANAHDERAIGVEATANGYLMAETFIPAQTVKAIAPSPLLTKDKTREVAFYVDLYAGPRPTVELVVPAGFRGIVKAEVAIAQDVPCPAGQRLFRFPVAADGSVRIAGPTLAERVDATDFHIRFADETPLSPKAHDTELGYWWLRHEENCNYFLVGDKADYTIARSNGDVGPEVRPHAAAEKAVAEAEVDTAAGATEAAGRQQHGAVEELPHHAIAAVLRLIQFLIRQPDHLVRGGCRLRGDDAHADGDRERLCPRSRRDGRRRFTQCSAISTAPPAESRQHSREPPPP